MANGDAQERYDFVIFGATGFTGQFVVDEVARIAEAEPGLRWAIAGRKMEKLQHVLSDASKRTGKNLEEIPIIIADVSGEQSLLEMCSQAKVVLNCVGPYRFNGEQVVRACIESKANHIDISGEPQFLEKMQLLYHGKAEEEGVYVVGSCGFDSIPADMGLAYTKENFEGDLNSVEAYLDLQSGSEGLGGNFATFESAVHGFAHADELPALRKSLFPSPLPRSKHRIQSRKTIFFSEDVDKWTLPFPGSDKSVVYRTQRYNFDVKKQRPVQFMPYFCRPSLLSAILTAFVSVIFGIMAYFNLTRPLLLKFPEFFTAGTFKKGGPSKKQMEDASFSMTFVGQGYSSKLDDVEATHEDKPDKRIVTKVSGPEIGYVTTPICMVQAGMVVLKEKAKLPPKGGVFTPGAAFTDTSLIKWLEDRGLKFQVVSEPEAK